jgi:mRNA interferase RelE/StbE
MVSGPRPYTVQVSKRARKELEKLPTKVQAELAPVLRALAVDPRPEGCKKLKGYDDLWRVAAGEYRILYTIEDRIVLVTVVRIADRKDVYRNL